MFGKLASIAYSRLGRTMAQYSGIKAAVANSENEWQTIDINRLAVFAVSLQCTDEVKSVSKTEKKDRKDPNSEA